MNNKIFHIDMDSFFASVEIALNPKYKNLPIAVGGRKAHGVISSANYIARSYGVKSAMKIYEAKKICPMLLVLECNMDKYIDYSYKVTQLLRNLKVKLQKASIDEWYIDLSNSKYEQWLEIEFSSYIKNLIFKKTNLVCSIGNSFTLFLAKTATNLSKPNGFLTLDKNNYLDYIKKIRIEKIVGVGPSTFNILKNEFNIEFVEDVLNFKNDLLIRKKLGIFWSKLKFNLNGIETSIIDENYFKKNISRSNTIKNIFSFYEIKEIIKNMIIDLNNRLKNEKMMFLNINLKIRFYNYSYKNKSIYFENYQNVINFSDITNMFENLIDENKYSLINNICITCFDLIENNKNFEQTELFKSIQKNEYQTKIDLIKQEVNQKFNKKIIFTLNEKN